jgi:hypothetical protein
VRLAPNFPSQLDHATGIVIGATAVMGNNVYCLHGVTLGATGKTVGGTKRHPTIGSHVFLGTGCTVLGDVAVGTGLKSGPPIIVEHAQLWPRPLTAGASRMLLSGTALNMTCILVLCHL